MFEMIDLFEILLAAYFAGPDNLRGARFHVVPEGGCFITGLLWIRYSPGVILI